MGAGASSLGFSSSGGYRFGEVAKESNHSSGDEGNNRGPTSSTNWVGKTLEMPPKPFSLDNYFQFHAVVGTGMLGKVRLIQHRKTKKYYALKSLKKKDVLARKMLAQLESEKDAMMQLTKLEHPFLARYFGSLQTTCHVHLVMEYVPGGELFHLLHKVGRMTNDETKFYATELVLFIEFCHANGYMYRDLKPENILLDGHGHIKVVDLGFIKKITSEDGRTSTCVGTSQYLAPEQLTNSLEKRSYSKSVDWWALACVIYEMVNGQTPFVRSQDDSSFELYTRIIKGQMSWPSRMHPFLKDLLRKMLVPDASKRLSDVEGIKQHAWFEHVDWHEVAHCEIQPPHVPVLFKEGDHSNFDEYPNSSEETKSPDNTFAKEFRHF